MNLVENREISYFMKYYSKDWLLADKAYSAQQNETKFVKIARAKPKLLMFK